MSELTILKAMKKDLELMLKREEDRDIYDEQLRREHNDELENRISREVTPFFKKTDTLKHK